MAELDFSISAPEAKEVYIAGDFNGWRLDDSSRMQKDNDIWKKIMNITPGRHHYRFVIDGKWVDDPNNPNKEKNPYGELDSLIEIQSK